MKKTDSVRQMQLFPAFPDKSLDKFMFSRADSQNREPTISCVKSVEKFRD